MYNTKPIRLFFRFIFILTSIACMVMIFRFSADTGLESGEMSRKVMEILGKGIYIMTGKDLFLSISPEHLSWIEFALRKTAHMLIYFLLSINVMCFLFTFNMYMIVRMFFTTLFCFAYACTDEVHQIFSAGRNAQFLDCLIDTAGAVMGLVGGLIIYCVCFTIFYSFMFWRTRRKEKKAQKALKKKKVENTEEETDVE